MASVLPPASNDFWISLQTALTSYNRPLIFLAVFLVAFFGLHLFIKGISFLIKLVIAIVIVAVLAAIFVISYQSGIKY